MSIFCGAAKSVLSSAADASCWWSQIAREPDTWLVRELVADGPVLALDAHCELERPARRADDFGEAEVVGVVHAANRPPPLVRTFAPLVFVGCVVIQLRAFFNSSGHPQAHIRAAALHELAAFGDEDANRSVGIAASHY